jgi:predicted membrane channel-forming protein YqfA (hemolysin III family)
MTLRDAIQLVILLIICGVAWSLLRDKIAEPFRTLIYVVVALALILYLLRLFGLY